MAVIDSKAKAKFRKLLTEERQRLINNSQNALKNDLALSPDDLADETDFAVGILTQSLVFKLRDRERHLLNKISEALLRLDQGTFGICIECEESIEPRRLEARPVSTLCISCKERDERRERVYA